MDNIYSPEKKTQLIKRLLEYGADPNEVSYKRRQSILTTAIERNMYDITKELINHGADINYIDNNRKSPLESTIQLGKSVVKKRLILFFSFLAMWFLNIHIVYLYILKIFFIFHDLYNTKRNFKNAIDLSFISLMLCHDTFL